MKRVFAILPIAALAATHCGGSAGAVAGATITNDAGAVAATDASPPPATYDSDAGWTMADDAALGSSSDGCAAGDSGSADPPDPAGLDTNCDGADGVVGLDVYVSSDVGADTNPGTPSAPLRRISVGLELAATRGGSVLVRSGTYPVDSFTTKGTWAVYGGYPSGFVGQPNRQTTTLTAPDTGLLLAGAASATLAHVTVEGDMPSDPTQPSAHALRTSVSTLLLLDVLLQSGDGLPMLAAKPGATGQGGVDDIGPLKCNNVQQPSYTSGSCCGEPSVEGRQPGSVAWGIRAQGSPGNPGADGNDAAGMVSVASGVLVGDVGKAGSANGTPGYGAATGGGSPSSPWTAPNGVSPGPFSGGNGGSGGCPGAGGSGGATGGSAVALLVLQGAVTIQASALQGGLGGNGGDGGQGGDGGPGGQGSAPYFAGPSAIASWPSPCTPDTDPLGVNCAEYGGIGGAGGVGGHGGGGAGGSTFGVITVGSATCSLDSSTTTTLGQPGSGGVGNGGGRAPNGRRAAMFHLN